MPDSQCCRGNRISIPIPRDGLAYGETGRFPGGPIGRWAGELLTPPTQNLSDTISELGPHLYHVNTVERSKIWRFLVSAPNIIEFCIKNKSVFSKVGRFNNIFPGRIFEPVRPCGHSHRNPYRDPMEIPTGFPQGENPPHSHSHGMIMGIPKGFLTEMQRSASDDVPDQDRTEPDGFRSVRSAYFQMRSGSVRIRNLTVWTNSPS